MKKIADNDLLKLVKSGGTFYGVYFCATGRNPTNGSLAFGRWEWFSEKNGLSFGTSRADAESLRRLTDAGYLTAAGATKGKCHRLTVNGWALARLQLGIDWEELETTFAKIRANVETSKICLPKSDPKIWLVQYDEPFDYEELHEHAAVLVQLGLVKRYVAVDGFIWGLSLVDGAALQTPDAVEIHDFKYEGEFLKAWLEGVHAGIAIGETKPPKETDNILPRLLPCSKWW
jgi:hypothetical protein